MTPQDKIKHAKNKFLDYFIQIREAKKDLAEAELSVERYILEIKLCQITSSVYSGHNALLEKRLKNAFDDIENSSDIIKSLKDESEKYREKWDEEVKAFLAHQQAVQTEEKEIP